MPTLTLSEQDARKMYPTAPKEIQRILINTFGENFFKMKITDRVQNWNDILSISGINPLSMQLRPDETDDELAYREAKLIAVVYNEGTVLDPNNTNQYKYFPWHKIVNDNSHPSGFGLSCYGGDGWNSISVVCVRLCFKEEALAIDAGKKFEKTVYDRLKIR